MVVLALFSGVVRTGFSRGDKYIPQVVNGPGWSTKFDLTNISPDTIIRNMRLSFYTNSGAKWTVPTNQGTGSDFTLTIGPKQTLRFETTGGSTMGAGYAVLYDEEPGNTEFSDDYVLGISVFYTASGTSESWIRSQYRCRSPRHWHLCQRRQTVHREFTPGWRLLIVPT